MTRFCPEFRCGTPPTNGASTILIQHRSFCLPDYIKLSPEVILFFMKTAKDPIDSSRPRMHREYIWALEQSCSSVFLEFFTNEASNWIRPNMQIPKAKHWPVLLILTPINTVHRMIVLLHSFTEAYFLSTTGRTVDTDLRNKIITNNEKGLKKSRNYNWWNSLKELTSL